MYQYKIFILSVKYISINICIIIIKQRDIVRGKTIYRNNTRYYNGVFDRHWVICPNIFLVLVGNIVFFLTVFQRFPGYSQQFGSFSLIIVCFLQCLNNQFALNII